MNSRLDAIRTQHLPALTSLRFVAALWVVIYHYSGSIRGFDAVPQWLKSLVSSGPIAVSFFFLLSGFVLSHSQANRRTVQAQGFLLKRFIKLYPAYLLAFLLFAPAAVVKYLHHSGGSAPHGFGFFTASALLSLTLLQAWTPLSQAWNGPSWSLSVEAFFYLTFPALLAWAFSRRMKTVLSVTFWSWLALVSVDLMRCLGHIGDHLWLSWLQNNPLLWTPLFVGGIVASRLASSWRLPTRTEASLYGLATAFAILSLSIFCPSRYSTLLIEGGAAPLFMLLVWSSLHTGAALNRVMDNRACLALGRISYIVYIVQAPVWHFFRFAYGRFRGTSNPNELLTASAFLVFLAALVLVSFTAERFVEIPIQNALRRRLLPGRPSLTEQNAPPKDNQIDCTAAQSTYAEA
jgi:peptidoglycan/LPS O-acetylase OafA/YrhL